MHPSVFEMFFRRCPFKGEYAIFGGLSDLLDFIINLHFSTEDIVYLRKVMPYASEEFFTYLESLDYKELTIRAPHDGQLVFANEPIIIVEGPLGLCQLIETTLLVLVNFPTLVATNACRMRVAVDDSLREKNPESQFAKQRALDSLQNFKLLEFGLRRAEGINGGMAASKYSILGGFNLTSNVLSSKELDLMPSGTMAHSFILSIHQNIEQYLKENTNNEFITMEEPILKNLKFVDFAGRVLKWKKRLFEPLEDSEFNEEISTIDNGRLPCFKEYRGNDSELCAFAVYAFTQPNNFIALVDTYDTLNSGLPNFVIVACVLMDFGINAKGIRLDSGDLSYLSIEVKKIFDLLHNIFVNQDQGTPCLDSEHPYNNTFQECSICASNDINEEILIELKNSGARIDVYGIGTNLVTCEAQPSLGGVYKLVEVSGCPRMKTTSDIAKSTIPCNKRVFRLYLKSGEAYDDIIEEASEQPPVVGQEIKCISKVDDLKCVIVCPAQVEELHTTVLDRGVINYPHIIKDDKVLLEHPELTLLRQRVIEQVYMLRKDYKRFVNPTPYKVSLSESLSDKVRSIVQSEKNVKIIH